MKKALSIKQPWASLICTPREDDPTKGIKDIENRTWKTNFRGRIYVHASAKSVNEPYQIFTDEQWQEIESNNIDTNVFESYKHLSRIIGEVDIVDCVINHTSIWAEQTFYPIDETEGYLNSVKPIYNWVLANPVLYDNPILNVKGKLSFWEFEKPENF